jgi:hypothetical protein
MFLEDFHVLTMFIKSNIVYNWFPILTYKHEKWNNIELKNYLNSVTCANDYNQPIKSMSF